MKKVSISYKILAVIMSITMLITSFPAAFAYAGENDVLGKVTVLSSADSAKVEEADGVVTASYNKEVTLEWAEANPSIGRNDDGWWAGIKIAAPEGYSIDDLKKATYGTKYNGIDEWTMGKSFWNAQDSDIKSEDPSIERYITMWGFINEKVLNQALANGTNVINQYKFDWNNDGAFDLNVNFVIDPSLVVLNKMVNGERVCVYPSSNLGKVSAITEAAKFEVTGSETNYTELVNKENITLAWSKAEPTIGRMTDGWWAGIKIAAPEGYKNVDCTNVVYKARYYGSTEWSVDKNFWKLQDSDINNENEIERYITMWAFVDEDVISRAIKNGEPIVNAYQFDWNNDGTFEQYIDFKMDPAKVKLDYTNMYKLDENAPVITVENDKNDDSIVWTNGNVTVKGIAKDFEEQYASSVSVIGYAKGEFESLSVIPEESKTAVILNDANEFSIDIGAQNYSGAYTVYCTDNAGNSAVKTFFVKMDNIAPTLDDAAVSTANWTNGKITITGTANDNASGVKSVEYKKSADNAWNTCKVGTDGKISIDIAAQNYEGDYILRVTDNAGNKSEKAVHVKMDKDICNVTILSDTSEYAKEDLLVNGSVTDNLSGVASITYTMGDVKDKKVAFNQVNGDTKNVTYSFECSENVADGETFAGDVVITVVDVAGNTSTVNVAVKIDKSKPELNNVEVSTSEWTNKDIEITGDVTDLGSGVEKVFVIKNDINNANNVAKEAVFDISNGTFTYTIPAQNYVGEYIVYCVDKAGNKSDETTLSVKMDIDVPSNVEISYSEPVFRQMLENIFKFYNAPCVVTLTSTDNLSGVGNFFYKLEGDAEFTTVEAKESEGAYVCNFEIPAQYRGKLSAKAIDVTGNETNSATEGDTIIVVDEISPEISVQYVGTSIKVGDVEYYNTDVEATITVLEDNFMDGEFQDDIRDIEISAKVTDNDGLENIEAYQITEWINDSPGVWVGKFKMNTEGDYTLAINYTDKSGNAAETYTRTNFVIDKTVPEIEVTYSDVVTKNTTEGNFAERTATIKVTECNFNPAALATEFEAKIANSNVETSSADEIKKMADIANWEFDGTNVYTYKVNFKDDANYTFLINSLTDLAGNKADISAEVIYPENTKAPTEFTIDTNAPENIKISYSLSVFDEVLSRIFEFYNASCTVTLEATDVTSGVQYFEYEYNVDADVSEINAGGTGKITNGDETFTLDENGKAIATFEIPAQFRGKVVVSATDNAGNTSGEVIGDKTVIVDSVAPKIDFELRGASKSVDGVDYYNENVEAIVSVKEANFMDGEFPEEVRDIEVSAAIIDENGNKVNESYQINNWVRNTDDVWVGTFTMSTEGDYTLTINYRDKSENKADTYTKTSFSIDKTAPAVDIKYNNSEMSDDACNDGLYFDKDRIATITVKEHNFDPSFITAAISAVDADGKNVDAKVISDLKNAIGDIKNWKSVGDNTYTLALDFTDDANYKFTWNSLYDFAGNEADMKVNDEFTVDKTKPEKNVTYIVENNEESSIRKALNVLTFGVFFNSKIEITVNATDKTAGLYKAKLSVKTDDNIINACGDNGVEFEISEKAGSKGTAKFTLDPADFEEFRGRLYVEIYDNSGNMYSNLSDENELEGTIVVGNEIIDNILQYEGNEYHKKSSSIIIKNTEDVVSNVDQSNPALEQANSLVKEKIDTEKVLEDMTMAPSNVPLFNTDVPLFINVTDESSGLSEVDIKVFEANENKEIASYTTHINNNGEIVEDVAEFEDAEITDWNLVTKENGLTASADRVLTVKKNSNDIVVLVKITDNVGNMSYDYYQFGIDKTAPEIAGEFVDSVAPQNGNYYSAARKLKLTVNERDFDNSDTVVELEFKYQGEIKKVLIPASEFAAVDEAPIYSDDKTYTYTVDQFIADGEYADFKFSLADRADNKTVAASEVIKSNNNNLFKYDHEQPIIRVISDEHGQLENGKYYQDNRTVVITVEDRYATTSTNMSYLINKADNLTEFSFADSEEALRYHTNKRTLTYTFKFATDTSIDCSLLLNAIKDLAGNAVANVPAVESGNDFVVDGKAPNKFSAIINEGNKSGVSVLNQSDYKVFVDDNITLTITCEDENLSFANLSNAKIVCAALTTNGKTKEQSFTVNKVESSSNRTKLVYSIGGTALNYDGFYDLTFTVTDDSGKKSENQNVKFAICRNGALYNKDNIEDILNHEPFNVNSVSDITFNQYSASKNTKATLTISSKTGSLGFKSRVLIEGVDYEIAGGNTIDSELNCYISNYTLKSNAFMLEDGRILDGVYLITVTPNNTASETGQTSENAQPVSFEVTIDATNPVISDVKTQYKNVIGTDKEYEFKQDDKKFFFAGGLEVQFDISDTFSGIDESTISVVWGDETETKEIVPVDENGRYKVALKSDDVNNGDILMISAKDKAGNEIEYSFKLTINNYFWIYVAIAAVLVIGLVVILILVIKSKKKSK